MPGCDVPDADTPRKAGVSATAQDVASAMLQIDRRTYCDGYIPHKAFAGEATAVVCFVSNVASAYYIGVNR